ncbi:nucleotidyltransferase family protein [Mucilaginibacter jinjuensis]|uniref:Nucleotidyltransferase family protein n=1 Tax=Mucilaginibacter jinjuensis TaxID=1176721 RepID=A0ABY7T6Z8_9SPHI|nr:nucleotidyltransferase family protein [Mucilaginibacter jinjuensis]WCT11890.1 nucleotidyltransferase family protein [Mucilaginibacter jinjuensis]
MLDTQQLKSTYNNEQILLVLLSRLYFSTGERADVESFIVNHTINWQIFQQILRAHGLRSFVYGIIVNHQIKLNEQAEQNLKKRYSNNRLKNFKQIKAAAEIVAVLKQQGIVVISYKGAIFAQGYYSDMALRESSDIDFLISKRDIKAIEDYFINQQYEARTTVPRPYLNYYSSFFKDIVYYKEAVVPASIEMHWRLVDRYAGNYPGYDFFEPHLVTASIGGLTIDKLSPTYDFLAVASNHFVKDMGIKFKYMVDMACMITREREALDLDVIIGCARQYGFEKKLGVGLQLVDDLLGIELIGHRQQPLSTQLLRTPLQYPIHLTRLYINEPAFIKRSLLLQDNAWNKCKFLLRCFLYAFLPTYADINELKLPVYLLPVLIIIRPFRLLYQMIRPKKRAEF